MRSAVELYPDRYGQFEGSLEWFKKIVNIHGEPKVIVRDGYLSPYKFGGHLRFILQDSQAPIFKFGDVYYAFKGGSYTSSIAWFTLKKENVVFP